MRRYDLPCCSVCVRRFYVLFAFRVRFAGDVMELARCSVQSSSRALLEVAQEMGVGFCGNSYSLGSGNDFLSASAYRSGVSCAGIRLHCFLL